MSETLGYIHSVGDLPGLVDGPGVRYIIFLQGAPCAAILPQPRETWAFTKDTAKDPAGGLCCRLPLPKLRAQQRRPDDQRRRAAATDGFCQ